MRTAIVTGATGNLGTAVVKRLLADGYQVAGTATKPVAGAEVPAYRLYAVDLTDEPGATAFVEEVIRTSGTIDVAVLTVGGFATGKFVDTSVEELRLQIRINVETAWNVARPVFRQMLEQGYGRIFLIGSMPGADVTKGTNAVAYALSKSLLIELARIINHEAGAQNIVCSVVVPSTIDTPQNHKAMPGADSTTWIPPETIADVIAWYAGPEAARMREPLINITG